MFPVIFQDGACEPIGVVAFSPDGRLLAATTEGVIQLWDVAGRRLLHSIQNPPGGIARVAFAPDGKRLAAVTMEGTIGVWSVDGRPVRRRIVTSSRGNLCLAFSPAGKTLATGGADNIVRLWDTTSWSVTRILKAGVDPNASARPPSSAGVARIRFSPDGQWLATVHDIDYEGEPDYSADYVTVWSTQRWKARYTLSELPDDRRFSGISTIAFSADSKCLASGHQSGTGFGRILLWNLATGHRRTFTDGPEASTHNFVFTDWGGKVALIGPMPQVTLWDFPSGRQVDRVAMKAHPTALAASPDGQTIAVGDSEGTVTLWRPSQTDPIAAFRRVWASAVDFR